MRKFISTWKKVSLTFLLQFRYIWRDYFWSDVLIRKVRNISTESNRSRWVFLYPSCRLSYVRKWNCSSYSKNLSLSVFKKSQWRIWCKCKTFRKLPRDFGQKVSPWSKWRSDLHHSYRFWQKISFGGLRRILERSISKFKFMRKSRFFHKNWRGKPNPH